MALKSLYHVKDGLFGLFLSFLSYYELPIYVLQRIGCAWAHSVEKEYNSFFFCPLHL